MYTFIVNNYNNIDLRITSFSSAIHISNITYAIFNIFFSLLFYKIPINITLSHGIWVFIFSLKMSNLFSTSYV